MLRHVYSFLLYLLTPFLLLRLYWKGRRLPAYRERISERFSLNKKKIMPVDVWLHAVSLGEVVAATPLIQALLDKGFSVLVTTMTPTGSQQVIRQFGERVQHQYLPYDIPCVLRRFFKTSRARVGIIMETELWPNVIIEGMRSGIKLFLVNARLSDGAFKQYQRVRWFIKPLLTHFVSILAQSDLDAQRFLALGASTDKVCAIGNIKFDVSIQALEAHLVRPLKTAWGDSRVVFMAASTHDDEEKQLLSSLIALKQAAPTLILLIAPRHPERFNEVYELACSYGFKTGRRSQPSTVDGLTEVVIIDSLGELLLFYQFSDYAFVGGSLVPVGGHNVLEPIALGVPVLCGPYMHHSKAVCEVLLAQGAIQQVKSSQALVAAFTQLYHHPEEVERQVTQARNVLDNNKGVVLSILSVLDGALE